MARLPALPLLMTLVAAAAAGPALAAAKGEARLFATESEAQGHCPSEIVVWVDGATRIYYYRGQNLYGSTKTGGYVCRKDLAGGGYRPNRTGR